MIVRSRAIEPILARGDALVDRWHESGDAVLSHNGLDKYAMVRNYAPYSIFPIEPRLRVKLMLGTALVRFHLNLGAIGRYLHERGWDIVRTPEEHARGALEAGNLSGSRMFTVRKGPFTCEIPAALVGRLSFELLRPRTLVAMLEAMFKRGPKASAHLTISLMTGEESIWD